MLTSVVEVHRFRLLHEAQLAAATLEASGIASEVRDNFLSGAEPDLVNAVGGIALVVGESDVLAAREILSADFSAAVPVVGWTHETFVPDKVAFPLSTSINV